MIDLTPLRRFNPNSPIRSEVTAAHLNQPIDELERLRNFVLANGGSIPVNGQLTQARLGVIVDAGPNDEDDDTTQSRYWVQLQRPDETLSNGDNLLLVDETMPGFDDIVSASNIAEDVSSHALATDGTVYVLLYQVVYDGFPQVKHWFFFTKPPTILYGKIISISSCNTLVHVHRCQLNGDELDTVDVSVYPTFGATADGAETGFAWTVGDVIAYIPLPEDATQGIEVGAYKSVSVGYRCSDSNSAAVPGLNRIQLYNGDFLLKTSSDCGAVSGPGASNVASIYWTGSFARKYGRPEPNLTIPLVKVWNFGTNSADATPSGTLGTDYTNIPVNVATNAATVNAPTVGGSPCTDESSPVELTVQVRGALDTFVKSIDSVVCNEDGTITVNYTTARAVIHYSP